MSSTLETLLERDAHLSLRLRLEKKNLTWWIAVFFAHSGDSWFWMAGVVLVWFLQTSEWHQRAATLAMGILFQAVTVLLIKFVIRRRRPEGDWGHIYRRTDPHSFPSGHAARAFLLATMATGLGPYWFSLLLVFWAPLVCLARVMLGVHYVSDVLAGALLGILLGWLFLQLIPLFVQTLPFLY